MLLLFAIVICTKLVITRPPCLHDPILAKTIQVLFEQLLVVVVATWTLVVSASFLVTSCFVVVPVLRQSHYTVHTGLELPVLQAQLPICWNSRHEPLCFFILQLVQLQVSKVAKDFFL